jgi:hypothetical protein
VIENGFVQLSLVLWLGSEGGDGGVGGSISLLLLLLLVLVEFSLCCGFPWFDVMSVSAYVICRTHNTGRKGEDGNMARRKREEKGAGCWVLGGVEGRKEGRGGRNWSCIMPNCRVNSPGLMGEKFVIFDVVFFWFGL